MASGNIKIWFLWAISAREGGGGGCDSRGRGEKMEGRLPDHKQICRKFTFTCFSMFGYVQFLFSLCAFSLFLMSSYLTELLMLS